MDIGASCPHGYLIGKRSLRLSMFLNCYCGRSDSVDSMDFKKDQERKGDRILENPRRFLRELPFTRTARTDDPVKQFPSQRSFPKTLDHTLQ